MTGLRDLPAFVYGTTRLGDDAIDVQDRLAVAREVLRLGLWIHTSDQYGDALDVLRAAVDERKGSPRTIVKVGGGSADDIRAKIVEQAGRLGADHVDIAQLSPVDGLDAALSSGDRRAIGGLRDLRSEGLVGRFVLEIFPWTSAAPLDALRGGHLDGLIDGFILYVNPLQRFASNALWQELGDRDADIISMRTVAGSDVHRLRDVPGAAWQPYLQERAAQVAPIFEASGVDTWVEFCMRFAHGLPGVRATVGSTARREHLEDYLAASAQPIPELSPAVMADLQALQDRWADETDARARPWTM